MNVQETIRLPYIAAPLAGFTDLGQLMSVGLNMVLIISAFAVLLYLFIGAFTYLTAGSDEDRVIKARLIISNSVVGMLLVSATWVIWNLVISFIPGLSGLVGQ